MPTASLITAVEINSDFSDVRIILFMMSIYTFHVYRQKMLILFVYMKQNCSYDKSLVKTDFWLN